MTTKMKRHKRRKVNVLGDEECVVCGATRDKGAAWRLEGRPQSLCPGAPDRHRGLRDLWRVFDAALSKARGK